MKKYSLVLLPAIALLITLASCNRDTVVKNSITFNKDIMKVAVYMKVDGKVRKDYSREIDVTGLSRDDRDALGKKILDSLQGLPEN